MNWNSHSVYKLNVPHYKKNYYWFWISPHFFSYHLYGLMNKCHYLSISILTGILLCTLTGPCLQEIRVGGGFLSTKSWYNIFGQKNEGKIPWATTKGSFWTSTRMTQWERHWPQKGISLERKSCLWKKGFFHQRPQCHPKKIWRRTQELSS